MRAGYVYIMASGRNGTLYIGVTSDLVRRVAAERSAHLNGEIVAADFYLRQITFLETVFDLTASQFGWDARAALKDLRRGEHGIMEIVSTDLADWLDESRRLWWAQEREPARPPHPDASFLKRHRSDEGGYSISQQMYAGVWADPPPGVDKEEWLAMTRDEQERLIVQIREQDAAEQVEWERPAHEAHQRSLEAPPRNGDGDHAQPGGGVGEGHDNEN